ncbi:MAG: SDR family oxidoreductase [bacterium]|nr:SDR family oxidoreductase [bacterium]
MLSIYRSDLFADRVALVTGGGSGIGLRTAKELALLGARVYICGRDAEKLEAAKRACAAESEPALELHSIVCNIRKPDEVAAMCESIVKEAGRIDLLVNNAGGQFPAPAEKISANGWNAVIDTNLNATFGVSQAVFTHTMKAQGGAIVNVIMDMYSGFPLMAHSGAARAAVDNLTKSLAHEWAEHGIRVNAVAPGVIESSGLETYEPQFRQAVYDMGRYSMANRLGSEAEVAAGILFLLSPGASYITGETLRIDGGSSIYRPHFPPKEHDRLPPFDR